MSIDLQKSVTEISKDRATVIDKLVKFSLTDMLLFWGLNEELAKRQKQLWLPILDWAKNDLQAKFKTTTELDIPAQDSHSSERLKMFLDTLTNKQLTGFYYAALNTRSVLLAAALIKGKINAKQAYEASCLEELWQAEKWGNDEAADCRRKSLLKELEQIETFLKK